MQAYKFERPLEIASKSLEARFNTLTRLMERNSSENRNK